MDAPAKSYRNKNEGKFAPTENKEKANPAALRGDSPSCRARADSFKVRLGRLVAVIAIFGGIAGGFFNEIGQQDAAALKTPGASWSVDRYLDDGRLYGYDDAWPGVYTDKDSLSGVLSAKLSFQKEEGDAAQYTERAVRVQTNSEGVASVIVSASAAQTPPQRNGKEGYMSAKGFRPVASTWTPQEGSPAALSIEPLGDGRWMIKANTDTKRPGFLWVYAASVIQNGDSRAVHGVAGFTENAVATRAKKAEKRTTIRLFEALGAIVCGLGGLVILAQGWGGARGESERMGKSPIFSEPSIEGSVSERTEAER